MSRLENHSTSFGGTEDALSTAAKLYECALSDTSAVASKLAREAALISGGLVGGTVAEIQKDPLKAGAQLAGTALAGSLIAGMAVAEVPLLSTAGLVLGAGLTGKWVWDQIDPNSKRNQDRNQNISEAVTTVWNSSDSKAFASSEKQMEMGLGSLGLDLASFAVGGYAAGKLAPQIGSEMSLAYKEIAGSGKQLTTFVADLVPKLAGPDSAVALAHAGEGKPGAGSTSESPLSDFVLFMAKSRHGKVHSRPMDSFDLNPIKEVLPENGKLSQKCNRTELEFPDGSKIVEDNLGTWWIHGKDGSVVRAGQDGDAFAPPSDSGFSFGAKGWRERSTNKR